MASMSKEKVNDYFEFPMDINLKPWTAEGVSEKENTELDDFEERAEEYYEF